MGLEYFNEDKPADSGRRQMTPEEIQKAINGELDVQDDDTVRELLGQEGLDDILRIENRHDELFKAVAQAYHAKMRGDDSLQVYMFMMSALLHKTVKEFTLEDLMSLISVSISNAVQLAAALDELSDEDDEDD